MRDLITRKHKLFYKELTSNLLYHTHYNLVIFFGWLNNDNRTLSVVCNIVTYTPQKCSVKYQNNIMQINSIIKLLNNFFLKKKTRNSNLYIKSR